MAMSESIDIDIDISIWYKPCLIKPLTCKSSMQWIYPIVPYNRLEGLLGVRPTNKKNNIIINMHLIKHTRIRMNGSSVRALRDTC